MNNNRKQYDRKQFIQATASGLVGASLLPGTVWGANDKLNIACIGIGGRGRLHVRTLGTKSDEVNLLAFADIDDARSEEIRQSFPEVPVFNDFREMIAKYKKEIDGVTVATPDHTHHYIAKCCLNEGFPVYVEKPLAHSIREVKDLMEMERKTGLACQMGNQGHSSYAPYSTREWLKKGIIGEVSDVHVWTTHNNFNRADQPAPKQQVPETLDWEFWLGPAPYRDYNTTYCPGGWRSWRQFGAGALGDMGCHCMDVPYYALDLKYPEEVIPECSQPIYRESFPQSMKITYRFPGRENHGPVMLTWYHGPDFEVPRPETLEKGRRLGTDHGGSYMVGSKETLTAGSHGTPLVIVPETRRQAVRQQLASVMEERKQSPAKDKSYNSNNEDHFDNWLNAIRGKGKCKSNFEYAGRLTQLVHLGNIATFLNTELKINPDSGDIIGNR